ncbi:MAG: glycosyltransferase family 2 protein [Candidatus Omnitrophica bacterium]|nr:glycosyltransferase family 2 protein [Candidatus Omnitrophota bacterium]
MKQEEDPVRLSVIIPTYNEAENLPLLVEQVSRALAGYQGGDELIVVDDDSPDRTWAVAESLRSRYPQVRVIRRTTGEKGLAPAVVEGWRTAQGAFLAVMDADLQHPPELLPALVSAFQDPAVDVVIASRYTANGERMRWNPIRRWISRGASNLAQAVLPPAAHGVTDPMSGFFALRRAVIEGASLRPRGYKILLEVLGRGRYHRVAEVPYVFGRRHYGQSKLSALVMRDYLEQLWRLAWAPTGFGRFVRFCLVGSTGVIVNMGILWGLKSTELLGTLRAGAVAIECSIINNFLWNELWTFRDRSRMSQRLRERAWRLGHFNLICGVGALFQLGMLWALAVKLRWHYLLANLLAIIVVTFWNYGLNTTWTWTTLGSSDPVVRSRLVPGVQAATK